MQHPISTRPGPQGHLQGNTIDVLVFARQHDGIKRPAGHWKCLAMARHRVPRKLKYRLLCNQFKVCYAARDATCNLECSTLEVNLKVEKQLMDGEKKLKFVQSFCRDGEELASYFVVLVHVNNSCNFWKTQVSRTLYLYSRVSLMRLGFLQLAS